MRLGRATRCQKHLRSWWGVYPVLGNVQVFYTDGAVNYVVEAPCGRGRAFGEEGEPLVTDLLLPLYLEIGDVAKALRAAREFNKCGLPSTPTELAEGIYSGRYNAPFLLSGRPGGTGTAF